MEIPCPKCGKPMQNLGNLDGIVMTSNPPCWYDIWVCHECKVKTPVMASENRLVVPDVSGYEVVK
jgi:hypothetical protein